MRGGRGCVPEKAYLVFELHLLTTISVSSTSIPTHAAPREARSSHFLKTTIQRNHLLWGNGTTVSPPVPRQTSPRLLETVHKGLAHVVYVLQDLLALLNLLAAAELQNAASDRDAHHSLNALHLGLVHPVEPADGLLVDVIAPLGLPAEGNASGNLQAQREGPQGH